MSTGYLALPRRTLLFMGGQVLSWMGDGIFVLAVPWLVYDLTHSALAVSASYTLSLAPRLLQPFLGALIDRVNPRTWLIASPGVQAMLVLSLVAAHSIGTVHLWLIYIVAFAVNLFAAGDAIAVEAVAPQTVSPHQFVHYNALYHNAGTLAWYVGPFIGGAAVGFLGIHGALLLDALTFAIMSSAAVALPGLRVVSGDEARNAWSNVFSGFRFLARQPILVWLVLFLVFWNFTWNGVYALTVYYFRDALQLNAFQVGFIGFLGGIVPVVWGLLTPVILRRLRTAHFLTIGIGLSGMGMAALAYVRTWGEAGTAISFMDGPVVLLNTLVSTIRQNITPPSLLGRVSAASRTIVAVFSLTAPILAGAVTNAYGAKVVMLGLGLATVVGSIGLMLTPLKSLHIPAYPSGAIGQAE
jgi:MFS family permease